LLDDAVAGVLDNTTYVLDGTTNFADVTTGINSVNVKRGRRDVGDQFSAGTMTFNMLDTTGIFNPFDTLSPYFDPATAQPGLAPMRKVRLARYSSTNVKELLFAGFVVNFEYNFALGGLDTVTVYCADDFYLLAQTFLAEFNVSEELSSARLTAVLDLPEVDFLLGNATFLQAHKRSAARQRSQLTKALTRSTIATKSILPSRAGCLWHVTAI
jgi:hypothetical protein